MQRFGRLIFNEKKQQFRSKNARCNMGMVIIYIMFHVSIRARKDVFESLQTQVRSTELSFPLFMSKSFRYTDNLQFEGAFAE